MTRVLAALLFAIALLPAALGPAAGARANGVPQLVKLTYLEGLSNFGPKDAEGVLEFSFAEGYAHLEVKNLTAVEGSTYEGWLTSPSGGTFFAGKLEPNTAGSATQEWKLEGLKSLDYNTFVVAARKGEAAGTMPAQKSIAGRFAVLTDNGAAAGSAADVRPGALPDTGEAAPGFNWSRAFYTVGAMGGVASAIFILRKRFQKGARS